jgi:hypothetical protein
MWRHAAGRNCTKISNKTNALLIPMDAGQRIA